MRVCVREGRGGETDIQADRQANRETERTLANKITAYSENCMTGAERFC